MSGSPVQQIDRRYELYVNNLKLSASAIDFTARRVIDTTPNTLDLVIYNLNPDHQSVIEKAKNPVVQLSAGYKDKIGVIYLGEMRNCYTIFSDTEWVTHLSSGDGEKDLQQSRVNKSFAPGVSYETVILEIANSMGEIGLGNLKKMIKKGKLPNKARNLPKGTTVSGQSKKELDRFLLLSGLEWSIQNRQFQVLEANKTLQTVAYVLSSNTGLVGDSPIIDNEGNLKATCLMNSDIVPGRQVQIKSRRVTGFFRVESCEYRGSTHGKDWIVDIEAKAISQ